VEKKFFRGNVRAAFGFDVGDPALLLIGQMNGRFVCGQTLHGKFVSGFHWLDCTGFAYDYAMAIRLLSTDFDGTLVGHEPDARTAASLSAALRDLRERGAVWAVNTGRQLWFALEGLEHARLPHDPEFVLSSEKDIYRRIDEDDWEAFGEWNADTERRTADLFGRAAHVIDAIREMSARDRTVEILYENGRVAGLMTVDPETMDRVVDEVRMLAAGVPEFSFNRNMVWMRFTHREIHKGSALAELSRLLGIPRDNDLAIGDHHNDLPMLDGSAAAMVACPGNAVAEVKETVLAVGGYVSPFPWGEGVADAIRHFSG
jgi:HAD superfamily hydrolase (TIGR01484 family)